MTTLGLKCCIVTEDTEVGKKLSALLYAVSEAIEKHYLRDFFILVSTDKADNIDEVIEAYTLTFTYADGGRLLLRSPSHEIVVSCADVTQLRKEVITLLHRLDILMNALLPAPQNSFPYFKLTYYASTPHSYEPTGFKSSTTTYYFKKMTFVSKISAGTFSTKFESCSVCLESIFFGSGSEQYEQIASVEKDELQTLKGIADETPTGRPKKDRLTKQKKVMHGEKARQKKIQEDGDSGSESVNLHTSLLEAQMEAVLQENTTEIIESVRASPLEVDSPNEPSRSAVLSCAEALANMTDLHRSDFSSEYFGGTEINTGFSPFLYVLTCFILCIDSEEVPESSGQFATFGSLSGPYINSPRMDSTVSLPTVTELVNREPTLIRGSKKSPSSGISIIAESDIARELFMRRSPNIEAPPNSEPKIKKMKISRSKVDYHKSTDSGPHALRMAFVMGHSPAQELALVRMKVLWWSASYNQVLHLSLMFAVVPWLYSYFNEQHRKQSYSVEQAVMLAWDKMITQPTMLFRRAVIGISCNVDIVVTGTSLLERLNGTSTYRRDHEVIDNVNDLYESFAYFFSRGAAAERHISDRKMFRTLVHFASEPRHRPHHYIGGNAALMAQKIATSFPKTTVYLVGPIGPRSQVLLHPSIVRTNSTRIVKDELRIIIEYKRGEVLDEYVAPASSRFITSHDEYSGSAVVIEMFFKAISQFNPDLVILAGVHLLQNQNKGMRMEKLRLIKRNLLQVKQSIPIHFQLGHMGNADHVADVLHRIVPHVDSLSLNEQELTFFSHVANGPYTDLYPVFPGAIHVYKVVDMLYWLLTKFGHDSNDPESKNYQYRLSRIHFHSLTFHLMVYKGTDWSNLASGLAAGAKTAARQSCKITNDLHTDNLELRISKAHLLDKEVGKRYVFEPQRPIASWMRHDVIFIYTPALICKFPTRTVGIDDAVSATGLIFSQFHRFSSW
ncbi:unnamed protein product [Litomosoides sigmodontis]|uniref:HORMA domain-containing protein n=1 Tax=Litomosoides sigmodontis TaxID=42156 RepID=A0A3P6U119_LITSI|nr:unnamed protein product [Litomosoides sigmodontis]